MKIGILTFHTAQNYGAVLQAYGLQEYLKAQGHSVFIIDYKPVYISDVYRLIEWKNSLYWFFRDCLALPIKIKRRRLFSSFIRNYLHRHPLDLQEMQNDFDAFILGSDQIWNPEITCGLDYVFMGSFPASQSKRVISYAASAGSIDRLSKDSDAFFKCLQRINYIGVREDNLKQYIQSQLASSVTVTLDPVLLAGRSVFESLCFPINFKRPYILVFELYYSELVHNIAQQIAARKGLSLVEVSSYSISLKNKHCLMTESLNSFVSLVRGAEYVVTSSFHGTAFAILFERDFNMVSLDPKVSERMHSLLTQLGLNDRIAIDNKTIVSESIDYKKVTEKLEKLRVASQTFLKNALS